MKKFNLIHIEKSPPLSQQRLDCQLKSLINSVDFHFSFEVKEMFCAHDRQIIIIHSATEKGEENSIKGEEGKKKR